MVSDLYFFISVVFGRPRGEPLLVDEHPVLEPVETLPPPVVEGMGP